jgi:hypothetical protein
MTWSPRCYRHTLGNLCFQIIAIHDLKALLFSIAWKKSHTAFVKSVRGVRFSRLSLRSLRNYGSRDSPVGIVTGCELEGRDWIPSGSKWFSPLHSIHTRSGAHASSYPMGTEGSFPGDKAVGVWNWPLTSSSVPRSTMMGLYLHSTLHINGMVLN